MAKVLLKEIIQRFRLPHQLQSDNGPSVVANVTQQFLQALGIKYHFHSCWGPQSSGKTEQANHILKKTLSKLSGNVSSGIACCQQLS